VIAILAVFVVILAAAIIVWFCRYRIKCIKKSQKFIYDKSQIVKDPKPISPYSETPIKQPGVQGDKDNVYVDTVVDSVYETISSLSSEDEHYINDDQKPQTKQNDYEAISGAQPSMYLYMQSIIKDKEENSKTHQFSRQTNHSLVYYKKFDQDSV